MFKFISQQGLLELKNYKYKSGGYSWLDNKLNSFWVFCVELFPMWVAPNLMTFTGFLFMIVSTAINLYYDCSLQEEIPQWTYLFSALSIFVYQTLDAIDGKQARRTQSSSPLGQLFDHGCDSFVMTFFLLAVAAAVNIQRQYIFYLFLGIQIILWATNQLEHHTGIMHTHVYNIGVTEMELIVMAIVLVSGIFGKNIWLVTPRSILPSSLITLLPIEFILDEPSIMMIVLPILPLTYLVGAYMFMSNVYQSKHRQKAINEWAPLLIFWSLQFVWMDLPIFEELLGAIIIHFGIIISLIVCKLIVCSTTKVTQNILYLYKDPVPHSHVEIIPFAIISVGIFLLKNTIDQYQIKILFWISFVITLFMSLKFLYQIINQITEYLGIYCFSIKKRKEI